MKKMLKRFSILLFCLLTGVLSEAIADTKPSLTLDTVSKKQGEFFTATVSGTRFIPDLWFNGEHFTMFRQKDGSYRALVPVENLSKPGSYAILAKADDWKEKIPVTVVSNNRPVQKIWLDRKTNSLKATKEEKEQVKQGLRTLSSEKLWSERFSYPCNGRKSSPFGVKRSYNGAPVSSYHKGIDIAVPRGTPVKSPAPGKVMLTGYESNRFHVHGNTVIIDHGQGLTSIYLHLHSISVKEGDVVNKGETIGTVGSTGISTGPHLHWGTYLYGTSVDPELFVESEY
ncbi:M23 family metallopeptidase [Prosthecochloris sp. SCSIO W1103]|uniref:M23 family metallopeptidase n=1 Tax=Prosthecochloris sp. SCSIO W1103 TaxID=2992244 RepID=UPI00223D0684|nr:M23 family metallopeptidase [Prosthecochloris sp. SCSIO W1103]UZJ37502.1 M23 family metallopeptidase [Prosthecochloris sp. SCSIO W1103]